MSAYTGVNRRKLFKLGAALGLGMTLRAEADRKTAQVQRIQNQTHLLIKNAALITLDPKLGDMTDADIEVQDGMIVAVGKNLAAEGAYVIEGSGKIVIPGLVDSHWHLWNSFLRNSAPTPQGETFFKSQLKSSLQFTPELTALGVKIGLAEAANSGITTVNNWAHNIRQPSFADAELEAMLDSGLRTRLWYGYAQDLPATAPMDFKDIQRIQSTLSTDKGARVSLGMAIRGPERTGAEIWVPEFAFAKQQGLPISTHIAVTPEMQQKRAIQQLAQRGLLNSSVQLVHATHANAEDVRAIAQSGASVCFTPISEMRVGYGLAPVSAMHRAGIPLGLGIDTLVLAGNANPYMIMQLTLNLATGVTGDELALTARDVLFWSTQGGANTMGLGDEIGSLTPGKRADLVLVDTRYLGMQPIIDPVVSVVQSTTSANVHTVIANGKIIKQDGKLLAIDKAALAVAAQRGYLKIMMKVGQA